MIESWVLFRHSHAVEENYLESLDLVWPLACDPLVWRLGIESEEGPQKAR